MKPMEDKNEISRVSVQMLNGEVYGVPIVIGKPSEVLTLAMSVIVAVLQDSLQWRRIFRKMAVKILWSSRPDWVRYWTDDWKVTLLGTAALTLCAIGFCYLMHGVIGV